MSYEIVRSIALKQDENGAWYANVTSACNNVRPHSYYKWQYKPMKGFKSKEDLQKYILLDFYYGNFHGGKSTKYGKFMTYLGGSWGCVNEKSRACKTYHFYDKLSDKLRNDYLKNDSTTGCWEFDTPLYERYCTRIDKLRKRQNRELRNALYKEFLEFKPTCKPTIIRLWRNNEPTSYFIYQRKGQRNSVSFADYTNATRYTEENKIATVKRIVESHGYKMELIEV